MTAPKYYMRRQDIIAAVAREDFDSASRALYKILIHSIEEDDPHVLSYSFVKTALAILANGPTPTPFNQKYIEKDGTITLDGADKFCNYATTAICLLYTTLMMTDCTDEEVNAAKQVMLSLFGSRASVEHVRSRCFELTFDVKPGNVIHWRGDLFADLAQACTQRTDPSWELNCLMQMITHLRRRLHETRNLRWSEKKAYNDELRRLHSEIHTSVEMHEIHEVVLFIKGQLCSNGHPNKMPGGNRRGLESPPLTLPGSQMEKHAKYCKWILDCLEDWRKRIRDAHEGELKLGVTKHLRLPSVEEIAKWIRKEKKEDSITRRKIENALFNALGTTVNCYALMRNKGRQAAQERQQAIDSKANAKKTDKTLKPKSYPIAKDFDRLNANIIMYWEKLPTRCDFVLLKRKPTVSEKFDREKYINALRVAIQTL